MPVTGTLRRFVRSQCMTTYDSTARSPRVLTPEERKARDAQRRADAEQAMREHEQAQRAFQANLERLRAERLAREAGDKSN